MHVDSKLQKPAVGMTAVTVLLQQKMCFVMKSLHKRHAEFPSKVPQEGCRSPCYDSTSKQQGNEDKLGIMAPRPLCWSADTSHVSHLALIESCHSYNPGVFAFWRRGGCVGYRLSTFYFSLLLLPGSSECVSLCMVTSELIVALRTWDSRFLIKRRDRRVFRWISHTLNG